MGRTMPLMETTTPIFKSYKTKALWVFVISAIMIALLPQGAMAAKPEMTKVEKFHATKHYLLQTTIDPSFSGVELDSIAGGIVEAMNVDPEWRALSLRTANNLCSQLAAGAKKGKKGLTLAAKKFVTKYAQTKKEILDEATSDPTLTEAEIFAVSFVVGADSTAVFYSATMHLCPKYKAMGDVVTDMYLEIFDSLYGY